ncbi:MAG: acetyl-coenzyme A synthetase N-terminal domain-containing protein, partial [Gammaproteobacteria bacterium]
MISEGDLLWTPGRERVERAHLTAFMRWLERERKLPFKGYAALWEWSVTDIEGFWQALWDYFDIRSSAPVERTLGSKQMPGADWFPGARLNYAEHALRNERPDTTAILHLSERHALASLSW